MSDNSMTNRIMHIHLASWRYVAALTLPPLAMMFHLLTSVLSVPLMVLFLITHYYCWRLWLDERLFSLLNDDKDLAEFDQGMAHLWRQKTSDTRSLPDRWRGTRTLFYRTLLSLLLLWLISLCSVLYLTLMPVD
ncbi:hypothetical protein [Pantoea sp. USHLN256]|uniref:hypothetical protein n=1 Tax=Pantoea sp. USHLN256 TaxID=3081293 RepID=UPI00301A56A6